MIKCKLCKRQTKEGESTGAYDFVESLNPKGSRIVKSLRVCMDCNGSHNKSYDNQKGDSKK